MRGILGHQDHREVRRTGGWADGRTGGPADGRTGGRADGGPAYGRTGGRADGRTGRLAPRAMPWGSEESAPLGGLTPPVRPLSARQHGIARAAEKQDVHRSAHGPPDGDELTPERGYRVKPERGYGLKPRLGPEGLPRAGSRYALPRALGRNGSPKGLTARDAGAAVGERGECAARRSGLSRAATLRATTRHRPRAESRGAPLSAGVKG